MSAKTKVKTIHFWAVGTVALYLIFSKAILAYFAPFALWLAFLGPFAYGSLAGLVFLYLFGHEDFFPLARQIEKEEEKGEQKWLKIFHHHGRVFICLAVGSIAGPLLGALTVRLLIQRHNFIYKYTLVFLGTIVSTILLVGITRGVIRVF